MARSLLTEQYPSTCREWTQPCRVNTTTTTTPASGEPIGDALEPQSTASDVSENGESARASARRPRAAPPAAGANSSAEIPRERESPLITAVEIENFKGIGRPMRVDLRPITLLFGRNSVGKSTVLHALCYAHEILSHRNVDAHKTSLGGDQIDLGGFRRFVHRHDLTRSVRLRFELNLRGLVLPELGGTHEAMPLAGLLRRSMSLSHWRRRKRAGWS